MIALNAPNTVAQQPQHAKEAKVPESKQGANQKQIPSNTAEAEWDRELSKAREAGLAGIPYEPLPWTQKAPIPAPVQDSAGGAVVKNSGDVQGTVTLFEMLNSNESLMPGKAPQALLDLSKAKTGYSDAQDMAANLLGVVRMDIRGTTISGHLPASGDQIVFVAEKVLKSGLGAGVLSEAGPRTSYSRDVMSNLSNWSNKKVLMTAWQEQVKSGVKYIAPDEDWHKGGVKVLAFKSFSDQPHAKDPIVLELQKKLVAAGYDPKGIDGNWGPGTESALKAYQGANNLPQTGRLEPGSDTAKKLGLTVTNPEAENQKQIPSSKLKPGWGEFMGVINIQGMKLSDGTTRVVPLNVHTAEGQINYMDTDGKVNNITVTGISVEIKEKNVYYLYEKSTDDLSAKSMLLTSFNPNKHLRYYFGQMKPDPKP